MTRRHTDLLLRETARQPVLEPDPFFIAALEDRLRGLAAHTAGPRLSDPEPERLPPPPVRRRLATVGAVCAAVVVLFALVAVRPSAPAFEPASTPRGDEPAGESEAHDPADAGHVTPPSVATGTPVPGAPQSASPPPAPAVSPVLPTVQTAPAGRASRPVEGSPPEAEPVAPEPQPIKLWIGGTPARAALWWEEYLGADFVAYVVLRTTDGSDPRYGDDATTVVHMSRTRDDRRYAEMPPVGSTPRYRVVAIDRMGQEVARSNVAEPESPARKTTVLLSKPPYSGEIS